MTRLDALDALNASIGQFGWTVADAAPWFVLLLLVLVAGAGMRGRRVKRKADPRSQAKTPPVRNPVRALDPPARGDDPLDGLRDCRISVRLQLMGRQQAAVYADLRDWAGARGLLVSTEVSLNALFNVSASDQSTQYRGWSKLKQKYLDFLILDPDCRPVCAVEYHGTGHFKDNARDRDAIKRFAFAQAGLPLIEVPHTMAPAALRSALDRAVDIPRPRQAV